MKAHPSYKDSGVTWIGEIPTGWVSGNIRRFAKMKTGHTPSRSAEEYWQDCTIPWFTLADVWQLRSGTRKFLGDTANQLSELGLAHSAAELLPAGTVVLSRTASVGFSGIMPRPMATSQDFWNWICGPSLLPEFLLYQFRAMTQEFRLMTQGSTHKTIYQAIAAGMSIVIPAMEEQRAIVAYLDRETARIDELIAEQEALIASLTERREAVVVAAVAPAGVGDRGQRLKHVVAGVRQGWSPQCDAFPADGMTEWSVLKSGCVNRGTFRADQNKRLPDGLEPRPETVVRRDEIVVSRASTRDLVGSAAVVFGDYPRLMLSDKLYAFAMDRGAAEPEFVVLRLGTRALRDLIELEASGASHSMQNISQADILNLPMDLPPLESQRLALVSTREQTSKLDDLTAECRELIALLKERRSALITAAVTGKIDVREASLAT